MNTPPYLRWDESGQQQLLARAEALLQRRGRGQVSAGGWWQYRVGVGGCVDGVQHLQCR
jgi:hypothetical protein